MVDLSIIIPSYNTKDITNKCIASLIGVLKLNEGLNVEIIVVDNASSDGSAEMLSQLPVISILSTENTGYAKANNTALRRAQGKYILYLNSDVIIARLDFKDIITYLDQNKLVGALTVTVNLPNGGIDPASHRGFPTLWRSFCYYAGLEKIFGKIPIFNKLFGGYHLLHLPLNTIHEIDSPTGAFFLTRKNLMDKLGGFDEDFFMYGEDLDLSFRIKKLGYKIIYYPKYQVTHLKYQSGKKNKQSAIQSKTKGYFYNAMKIFYQKHYAKLYPGFINTFVYTLIDLKHKAS